MDVNLSLDESQRDKVTMALAHLAVERPGWAFALGEIADSLKQRELFDGFKTYRHAKWGKTMPVIKVHILDLFDPPQWPELASDPKWVHLRDPVIEIMALEGGMHSGQPSLTIRLDLPDGTIVTAETSLAVFQTANATLRGRFGDPGLGIEGRG